MKISYYIFFSLLILSFQSWSQSFEWAKSFSGPGYNHSSSITVDQRGYLYSTGYFFNTVDFNPDTGVFNLTSTSSSDIYISKLDTNGGFIWAKSFTGSGTFKRGLGITVDEIGNVYTTGRFNGKVDFDPSPAASDTFFLNTVGNSRGAFISKLDSNGSFVWVKQFTGNGTADGNAITIDELKNVYITGNFVGTIDFNPGPGTFNMSSIGASDMFVSKLDSNGNFLWAGAIAGTSIDEGVAISIDQSGNVCLICGVASQSVDVDPSPNVINMSTNGGFDVFVIKLDASGNYLWANNFGGSGFDRPRAMVMDSYDNIYITGLYQGTSDFNPDTSATFNLTSAGMDDVFLVKLDGQGTFVWANSIGGVGRDRGNAIAIDNIGNIYLSGEFNDRADFDPGIGIVNLSPLGNFDAFIAKYRSTGDLIWATAVGGLGLDVATSVVADQFGSVYTTGKFIDSVDFNPGAGIFTMNTMPSSGDDIFIQKLGQCWLPPTEQTDSLCSGDTLVVGSSTYTATGKYIDIIVTNNSCDSAIFTDLEIIDIDVSYDTSVAYPILRSNQSVASYQWLDCNNGFAPIVGETNQSYTVTSNGSYAVEISLNGCVDTTACESRVVVGLKKQMLYEEISIYPNPSKTFYTVHLTSAGKLDVYDVNGQLHSTAILPAGKTMRSTSDFEPGVYFLRFSNESTNICKRLVVVD